MSGWFKREWERFANSYDPMMVQMGSGTGIVVAIASCMTVVFAAAGYFDPLSSVVGLRAAWVSILLSWGGAALSLVAQRHGGRGRWGVPAALLDNSFYVGALAWAAAKSNPEAGYVFAGALGLTLVGFQGAMVKPTALIALAFIGPTLLVVALTDVDRVVAFAIILAALIGFLRTLLTRSFAQVRDARGSVVSEKGVRYRLGGVVGAGGMGIVYRALDPAHRTVAVKCIHPMTAGEQSNRERLLREALIVNSIDHPGVVPILDHGEIEHAGPFLVMELLAGKTLRARVEAAGGRLPWLEVLPVAETVLGVLQAAHEKGIVHCDVKPSNVFVCDDGRVKLLDFGIARPPALMLDTTLSVHVAGTPACMAPEQVFEPAKVDARSDLWGLGATMFWAITGEWPRALPEPIGSLLDAARMPARPIGSLASDVPEEVCRAIDRALSAEPGARWQSAAEMLGCLRVDSSDTHRIDSTREEPLEHTEAAVNERTGTEKPS